MSLQISHAPSQLRTLALAFSLSLLALTGCSSTPKPAKCDENQGPYLQAQNNPTLNVPADLAKPDSRSALTIPNVKNPTVDTKACLQQAPTYFGSAGRLAASPEEVVADWAQAWADRSADAVISMYSSKFSTDAPSGTEAWLAQRKAEILTGPLPKGRITNLRVIASDNDQRTARFTQTFGDVKVNKELTLIRDSGVWKISAEQVITAQ